MTEKEFNEKLLAYKLSDAPVDVKKEAIEKLKCKYEKATRTAVLKDIEDGQGDMNDIEI